MSTSEAIDPNGWPHHREPGVSTATDEQTPAVTGIEPATPGGPFPAVASPLLSNVTLDELRQEIRLAIRAELLAAFGEPQKMCVEPRS